MCNPPFPSIFLNRIPKSPIPHLPSKYPSARRSQPPLSSPSLSPSDVRRRRLKDLSPPRFRPRLTWLSPLPSSPLEPPQVSISSRLGSSSLAVCAIVGLSFPASRARIIVLVERITGETLCK